MIVDPFEENIRFCVYLLRTNVRMQCARPIIMCVPNVVNVTTSKSFAAAKDNPRPSLDNHSSMSSAQEHYNTSSASETPSALPPPDDPSAVF